MIRTKFSVQIHRLRAKRSEHFDLRVLDPRRLKLWSWALPKARFPEDGEKLLAIRTPDHPVSYIYFQGVLKKSGDTVKLHDSGICEILVNKSFLKIFHFHGKNVDGIYNFIKLSRSKDSWLITKSKKQ